MPVQVKVGTFNTPTSGTLDVTDVGFEPEVVLFWWSGLTAALPFGAAWTDARRGVGVGLSSANRRAATTRDRLSLAFTRAGQHEDACIRVVSATGLAEHAVDYTLALSNGFRLTWIIGSTSYRVHYLALRGLANSASGKFTEPAAAGLQSVQPLAFQPDLLLLWTAGLEADAGFKDDSTFSVGAGRTAAEQAVLAGVRDRQPDPTVSRSYCRTGEIVALFDVAAALNARAALDAMLPDGWRLDWTGSPSGTRRIFYLALRGIGAKILTLLTKTNTVDDIVVSGAGFGPLGALVASHAKAQSAAGVLDAEDEWALGGFSGAASRAGHGTFSENGAAPANQDIGVGARDDELYVHVAAAGGVASIDGLMDVKTVDSDGATFIMDDADPSAAFAWVLFLGEPPPTVPLEADDAAAEAALLGQDFPRPTDSGVLAAEAALLGIVDPELLNVLAEAALLGTDELNAPAPTSRIVRKTARPVTWES